MTHAAVIIYMTLLLIKHSLADLNLQGRIPGGDTSKLPLLSRKNTIHSLDHAVLGWFCTIWFAPVWLATVLAVGEFVTHYAIDHCKTRLRFALNISTKDRLFWHLQGVDQMLHTLTYVAMAWIVLSVNQ